MDVVILDEFLQFAPTPGQFSDRVRAMDPFTSIGHQQFLQVVRRCSAQRLFGSLFYELNRRSTVLFQNSSDDRSNTLLTAKTELKRKM